MNQQWSEIKEALSKANLPYNYHEDTGDIYGPGDDHLLVNFIYHNEDAELILNAPQWLASLVSQVEEMQKTLEWYASRWNHEVQLEDEGLTSMQKDNGERARQTLQSLKGDKP